jgi:hypothetical protein
LSKTTHLERDMHWIVVILGLCLTALSFKVMLDYLNNPGPKNSIKSLATIIGMTCGIFMVIFGAGL